MKSLVTHTDASEQGLLISRRKFLTRGLAGAAMLAAIPLLTRPVYAALLDSPTRSIALMNMHTGENCDLTYWEDGEYIDESLVTINRILRDHRNNEEHPIDVALLDLLTALHSKLDTTATFEVISGYRSPSSNAAMHAHSKGVAKHSLHMQGKAVDIRMSGRSLAAIHKTALDMGLGGVGYYPSSNFVHVDTGKVRQWRG